MDSIGISMKHSFQDVLCNFSGITLFLLVAALICILTYFIVRDIGLPPGPTGVPLLGYWPFMQKDSFHLQMYKFKEKYGNVFSYRVTGKLYIFLSSSDILKEALVKKSDCFMDKLDDFSLINKINENTMSFTKKNQWIHLRKFFMNQFRHRGIISYRENAAQIMYNNINDFVEDIRKSEGKPCDLLGILVKRSSVTMRHTLFGINTTLSEEDVKTYLELHKKIILLMFPPIHQFPIGFLAKYFIVPFTKKYREGLKRVYEMQAFLRGIIEERKRTYDADNLKDIIDVYIHERDKRRENGDPSYLAFTDINLAASIQQFIGDATLNGAMFITHMMKPLLDYPEEQEKIYKEIVQVCGKDRNPTFKDRPKMPYINAFIYEAIRSSLILPLFPSLACTRETTVGGYRIPVGSVAVLNTYSIHNDPETYEHPEKFNVPRYFKQGNRPKSELPVTFGIGKRLCLGEKFMMSQTFLYATALVRNFKFAYANTDDVYELKKTRVFEIVFTPRN